MASIWKTKESKYWQASWTDAQHKRYTRSTRIEHSTGSIRQNRENEARAMQLALEYEGVIRKPTTEQHVRKVLEELSAKVNPERIRFSKVDSFLGEWLGDIQATRTHSTWLRYEKPVADFLKGLGDQKDCPLEDITTRHLQQFYNRRVKSGVRPSTAKLDVKCLSAAFESARKQGLILHNPCNALNSIDSGQETRTPFSPDEVIRILKAAKGSQWETTILLSVTMGLRLSDAVSIRWSSIDLTRRTLTFRPIKTQRKRVDTILPLSREVERHLLTLPGNDDPEALLTPELATVGTSGRQGLSLRFLAIMRAAGVDAEEISADGQAGRIFRKKSFHSLRHTFIFELNKQGVDAAKRQLLAGHKSDRVHQVYSHDTAETLRPAIESLPELKY